MPRYAGQFTAHGNYLPSPAWGERGKKKSKTRRIPRAEAAEIPFSFKLRCKENKILSQRSQKHKWFKRRGAVLCFIFTRSILKIIGITSHNMSYKAIKYTGNAISIHAADKNHFSDAYFLRQHS